MPKWEVGVKTNSNTAMYATYHSVLAASYAINFGSGARTELMQAIQLNSYADNIHIVDGFTASESDVCTGNHAYYVKMGTDTGTFYGYPNAAATGLVGPMDIHTSRSGVSFTTDPFMPSYNTSSPAPYEGILFHFKNESVVAVTPVTLHVGSGAAVTGFSNSCHVEALELATTKLKQNSNVFTGWKHITPGSKLTLTAHNKTSTGHSWWVAMTLKGTAVGFHSADCYMKIEGTYF